MSNFFDEILYQYALSHLNLPYKWGGDDPISGYDCSGFVIELLKSVGELPHRFDTTAQGLYDHFLEKTGILSSECYFGALVFYGSGVNRISHVAFGLDHVRIIEAGGGGRTVLDERSASKQNAYIRIRPVDYRSDRVAILLPPYENI